MGNPLTSTQARYLDKRIEAETNIIRSSLNDREQSEKNGTRDKFREDFNKWLKRELHDMAPDVLETALFELLTSKKHCIGYSDTLIRTDRRDGDDHLATFVLTRLGLLDKVDEWNNRQDEAVKDIGNKYDDLEGKAEKASQRLRDRVNLGDAQEALKMLEAFRRDWGVADEPEEIEKPCDTCTGKQKKPRTKH